MSTRRGLLVAPKKLPDKGLMEKRGTVAHLAALSQQYRHLPMAVLRDWIDPALMADQLVIFYKWNDSLPVGYISWAFLAADVEDRWMHDPKASLHPSEWNEGETLWIMDFLALPGYCEDIVEYVDQHMFAGHAQAFSIRRNHRGQERKFSSWKRRNGTSRPDRAPAP
jgi:cytolysin-activating lysine-acyltransferase